MLTRPLPLLTRRLPLTRMMSTATTGKEVYFSTFEVSSQVFYTTPLSYALVNLKPILPGHVLVVPHRRVPRMTDLSAAELADLFGTVQKVQRMLAGRYFQSTSSSEATEREGKGEGQGDLERARPRPEDGSFNIAIQDGREAGQTVPHVHCHVIPRLPGDRDGDGVYERLQGEGGNVGGGYWDLEREREKGERPVQRGKFPRIEDADRKPRTKEDMKSEADEYRVLMEDVD